MSMSDKTQAADEFMTTTLVSSRKGCAAAVAAIFFLGVLLFGLGGAIGYYRGCLWANRECWAIGYDTGFHAGVTTAAAAYESGGMDAVVRVEKDLEDGQPADEIIKKHK